MRVRQLILNLVLAPLVILGAILLVKSWIANKPPPKSRKPPTVIPKVEIVESRAGEHAPTIHVFGNVRAYQQTQVASQVGGKILTISDRFLAGKSVTADQILLTIDPADYLAEIEKQKSALATAKRTLAEEESRSRIALQDWVDSGRRPQDAPPFTLRKPQLAAAQADLASATAALEKAQLDLERTQVRAPFDAIVQERTASPGNVIQSGTALGTLIDRARAEVRLPLTPEQAAQLDLPLSFSIAEGEVLTLSISLTTPSQPGVSWPATITRTEPSLDPTNQVLYVVAEIPKPFDDPGAFLPIGAYVNATISGTPINGVHRLPESALLEDRYVWILDPENKLRRQPVQRVFSSGGYFLAKIPDPVTPEPLRVTTRPLVTFAPGDQALPVGSQESGVRSQESGVSSQESGVRSQESGVSNQRSACHGVAVRRREIRESHSNKARSTKHKAQSTKHEAQSTKHKAQSTKHKARSTKHKAQSTKHEAQSTKHKAHRNMPDNPFEKHPIITWFAANPVVANLIMISILAGGVWTALGVRKETFPQFDAQSVEIQVPFLGGTPEDVERGVAIKVEESLQSVDGIDHIRSTSRESGATITVEAIENYPIGKLLNDVKIQVDAIPSFPEEAEKPVISEQRRTRDILWVAIHGEVPEATLKETARQVRDELLKLPNISRIDTFGARDYEISVEVAENKLRAFQLTFDEVAQAVANNSLDLSGGVIRSERGEISIRSRSQAYTAADFEKLPLRTAPDGTRLYLREVATIRDGFVDQEFLTRFDGKPAIALQLITEGRDNTIEASRDARAFIVGYGQKHVLPAGVTLTPWDDSSKVIESRLQLMIRNGLYGIGLVFLVLSLFLNLRLAFWVAVGIPVSIGGAMILFPLPFIDFSLNQLTTFAFIVVLGIIVDDAIIIGESIYAAKEQQKHPEDKDADLRATVRGVSKVFVPAAFGVLTTIAAFYPLTNVAGRMGSIYGIMAMVVIFCLIFSLIESKIILPSHLAHIDVHHKSRNPIARSWEIFQGSITSGLRLFITRLYLPALRFLVPYRYVVLGAFIAGLITVVGLIPSGKLRFVFFPSIFRDNIAATLELEQGQPVEYLHASAERIEDGLRQAARELEEQSGDQILLHVQISSSSTTRAAIAAQLTPSEERQISTGDLVTLWRKKVGPIAGAKALSFAGTAGPPGQGFNVQLESPSLEALRIAADELKAKIATFPGVSDVQDTFDDGQPEIQLRPTPVGEAAGLDRRDLARNVRDAFYGREAQRVQRGRDEVKVMVRYPADDRRSLDTLRDMRVRSAEGAAVPFSIVADASYGESLASIQRADFKRIVSVIAEIDKAVTSGEEVLGRLQENFFPTFLADHPDVSLSLRGEAEQRAKSLRSLGFGFVVSVVLIFVLLAVALKSYTRPLFIMSVIPFGIGGAILGHYIYDIPLSILSMFGTLALSGVVVNDSLVFVHRIHDIRRAADAMPLAEAIRLAAEERFRPILLTSLTTFAGLIPLLTETAVQAQFLKPMAVSLGFGVLFATGVTLLLLPMILLIANDLGVPLRRSFRWWRALFSGKLRSDPSPISPA